MKSFLLFLLASFASLSMAQTLPTEKVFFASDRMHYDIGDSIYISGWLTRTDSKTTSPYSRYLYVEMVDCNDSIYTRQKISVDQHGGFTTVLPLNASTQYGTYFLRAFSKLMCNFSDITILSYPIEIRKEGFTRHHSNGPALCRIYPEGGHLSSGGIQKMAVYITDADGNPWQTPFSITDAKGAVLFSAATTASGWQMLSIQPQHGVQYYLRVEDDNDHPTFAFPLIDDSTPSLHLTQRNNRIGYSIEGKIPEDAKLFAYNQSTGLVLLPLKKQGDIDMTNIGYELVSLILTDNQYNTLSEGHLWHSQSITPTPSIRTEYATGETLSADSILCDSSAASVIRFIPLDEMTHALTSDYLPTATAVVNFETDLTSEVPFPSRYALTNETDRTTDINCWLLSANFCRLDIAQVMKDGWTARYQPEVANVIRGKIYGGDRNWKLKEGTAVAYQHSNARAFTADMRKDGTFYMPIGDYAPGDYFFVCASDKKNEVGVYDYDFLSDTIPSIRNYRKYDITNAFTLTQPRNATNTFNWKGVNALPEVKITARVKKDYAQEEKVFYGNKLITEEQMDKRQYQSFQQIIYHFAPYMRLTSVSKGSDVDARMSEGTSSGSSQLIWHLYPASRISTLSGSAEIKIYIDGVLTEATNAVNLYMDNIATVEFLGPAQSLAYHPFCLNGCLEIKTKDFKLQKIKSKGVKYIPAIGIANYNMDKPATKAPQKAGTYVMIIDRLTSDYSQQTIAREVTVK